MEKRYKYPVIAFLLWIVSPIIILAIISLYKNLIIDPKSSFINIVIPGLIFSIIAFFITKITKHEVRVGSFYALIGAIIWASPAIYFLPASTIYSGLSTLGKFLIVLVPTTILSLILFIIGKTKSSPQRDITDLYIKNYLLKK